MFFIFLRSAGAEEVSSTVAEAADEEGVDEARRAGFLAKPRQFDGVVHDRMQGLWALVHIASDATARHNRVP